MATDVTMPQLSDTMDEGTILTWLKSEGDSVSRGDALAEVATDKADLEIECFHEGTLIKVHAAEGATVKVGEVIAVIGEEGESVEDKPQSDSKAGSASKGASKEAESEKPAEEKDSASSQKSAETSDDGGTEDKSASQGSQKAAAASSERVKISPLARNIAESNGLDYSQLSGSGEAGRITRKDVEEALGKQLSASDVEKAVQGQPAASSAPSSQKSAAQKSTQKPPHKPQSEAGSASATNPAPQAASLSASADKAGLGQSESLSRMRQTIADRMVQSVQTAPHFYATAKLNVSKLVELRATLKELPQYEGITFNHLVTKAVGLSLREHPRLNSFYREGTLITPAEINVGIITALPDGLIIPVLKSVDSMPLADVVAEANALVARARSGRPKSDDLSGGTFSISNIGKAPVENFTAIINPGQGAILAVAGIQDDVVVENGKPLVAKTMSVTVSVDHRIIDGVVAGQFLASLKQIIEKPVLLLA